MRILGFDENAAAKFISTQLKNSEVTAEQIMAIHKSLLEIYKNPLYATMIVATGLTSKLLNMELQMRIKEIFDNFAAFQKECYYKKYPHADTSEWEQLVEQLGKYALKFFYFIYTVLLSLASNNTRNPFMANIKDLIITLNIKYSPI